MLGMESPSGKIASRDRAWFKKAPADDAIKSLWSAADNIGGPGGQVHQADDSDRETHFSA